MTLIAHIAADNQPTYLVSDLALSGPISGPMLEFPTPLQICVGKGFTTFTAPENKTVVNVTQKMTIFGRHALLWADSFLHAMVLTRELARQQDILNPDNFLQIAEEALGGPIANLNLIYCYVQDDDSTSVLSFNVRQEIRNGVSIRCAGSGEFRFLDEADAQDVFVFNNNETTNQLLSRLRHVYQVELSDEAAYYYNFGVGYEIAVRIPGGWQKLTYTVPIFQMGRTDNGYDTFGLSGIISYSYFQDALWIRTSGCSAKSLASFENWHYMAGAIEFTETADYRVGGLIEPRRKFSSYELDQELLQSFEKSPDLTFSILGRGHGEQLEVDVLAHAPGVIGVRKTGTELGVANRAFFFRDVESRYIGREFEPPPHTIDFYAETLRRWKNGDGIEGLVFSSDKDKLGL